MFLEACMRYCYVCSTYRNMHAGSLGLIKKSDGEEIQQQEHSRCELLMPGI
jgi:hypothetical protein